MTFSWTMLIWGLLLVAQNFAHTVSQRAKNQNNLWYTGTAGVFANGIWIMSNFMMVDEIVKVLKTGRVLEGLPLVAYYTACTTFGTVFSQYCAMRWIEAWFEREKKPAKSMVRRMHRCVRCGRTVVSQPNMYCVDCMDPGDDPMSVRDVA